MRKLAIVTFLAVVSALTIVPGGSAGPASVFIDETVCGMIDAIGEDTIIVVTNNANGNSHLRCTATITPPPGGKAIIWNHANTGLTCGTTAGETASWQQTVSASGKATLQCHTNPGNPQL